MRTSPDSYPDEVERAHIEEIRAVGDDILSHEDRSFAIDEKNEQVIRFLLHYFRRSSTAEQIFPGKEYKLHRNLLICGKAGSGKTLLMQVFSEFLRRKRHPMQFVCLSVGQLANYYARHNHMDRYTYNEDDSPGFQCNPVNVCMNDIGIRLQSFYGNDTNSLCAEFLFARYEIWQQYGRFSHITTNLDPAQTTKIFSDEYNRLPDRFKSYNVIHLKGDSRR